MGAILFLIVTIPLARFVDYLIARQQRKTGRGGSGDDGDTADLVGDPVLTGGSGMTT